MRHQRRTRKRDGFTLAEIVLGGMVLAIALAAILGAYVGQITLNEHARNLSLTIHDANRIIEQIRQSNTTCGNAPTAQPPSGTVLSNGFEVGWDNWLATAGGGRSLPPVPPGSELVVATCQDRDGNIVSCATPPAGTNPLRVTVAVCWRHRERTIGECTWNAGTSTLTPDDSVTVAADTASVIDSPAMLTTLVTCRG